MSGLRRTSAKREDAGFTLIELLISIVLLTIIIGVIAFAFDVDLRSLADDQAAVSSGQDAAATTGFLDRDVQSANTFSTATPVCGTSAANLVLALAWIQPSQSVDYAYSAGSLTRVACGTAQGSVTVASQLSGKPSATCSATSCGLTISELDGTSYSFTAYRRVALP